MILSLKSVPPQANIVPILRRICVAFEEAVMLYHLEYLEVCVKNIVVSVHFLSLFTPLLSVTVNHGETGRPWPVHPLVFFGLQ